jgi:hypothetical protein
MDQVSSRTQQMSRMMNQQMERLQDRDREQMRLLLGLCDGINAQARETRRSMDGIRTMLGDGAMMQDRDMVRDMERLHERLHSVTEGLEEMVQTLERMNKRLQVRGGTAA